MPELPEVERARRIAERVALNHRIRDVFVADDEIVIAGTTPSAVRDALDGARVTGTGRRGKYFWLELDRRPWPIFHLGMTGGLETPNEATLELASHGRTTHGESAIPEWPPRFAKVDFGLVPPRGRAVRTRLAFTNARRLGRVRLSDDPLTSEPIAKLGFDPLHDFPSPASFADRLASRGRANVKGLLLDQSFCAGVGNWIADEVLYQAKIDPHRAAGSLQAREVQSLRSTLHRVIERACEADADKSRFPKQWLFHKRWRHREGETRTIRGHEIAFDEVAGRRTAWVPDVQR